MEKEVVYVADPMCGWCWGFAPVSRKIADTVRGTASMRVLPGGLRMGTTMPLHASEVESINREWEAVLRRTGQPFDFSQPVDDAFVYDTGPSCAALSLMSRLKPLAALDYLHSLQQAFFVGRRDLKDPEVLADYAVSYGVKREDFLARLDTQDARDALDEDLYRVHKLGITAFPVVLLQDGPRIQRLTTGYQPWEALEPAVSAWLAQS